MKVKKFGEKELTNKLVKEFRKEDDWVIVKHHDMFTYGLPDLSCSLNKKTTWIEVKYVKKGKIITRGQQQLFILKFQKAADVFYVLYVDLDGEQRTYMLPPDLVKDDWIEKSFYLEGFNHEEIVKTMRRLHTP